MPISARRFAAFRTLLVAGLLVGCGATSAPSTPPPSVPPPVAAPSLDAAGLAYSEAMCPVFTSIIELDPDLAALRELGASDGDVAAAGEDLDSATSDLLALLTALEAVPTWGPGAELRYHLISALHIIRTQLVTIADDPGARTSADLLAELPFIANEAMDRAMREAVAGGLTCEPGG